MTEKEETFRKINEEYNTFSYIFYDSMRQGGSFWKKDVDKQIDKLINHLLALKNIK